MAVTVVDHMVEGTAMSFTRAQGYTSSRMIHLKGLAGGNTEVIKFNALNDSNIPGNGSRHPSIGILYVESTGISEVVGPDSVIVRVNYVQKPNFASSREGNRVFSLGGGGVQEEADKDKDGNKQPTTFEGDEQGGSWSAFKPQVRTSVTKVSATSPLSDAKLYIGRVNSVKWRVDPDSGPRTWLCTDITGTSEDNGQSYVNTYQFLHATDRNIPQGETEPKWDIFLVYRKPNGHVLTDAETIVGTTEKSIKFYKEADFNALNLAPGDRE